MQHAGCGTTLSNTDTRHISVKIGHEAQGHGIDQGTAVCVCSNVTSTAATTAVASSGRA